MLNKMNFNQSNLLSVISILKFPTISEIRCFICEKSYFKISYRKLENKTYPFYYYHLSKLENNNFISKFKCIYGNRVRFGLKNPLLMADSYIHAIPKLLSHKNDVMSIKYGDYQFTINTKEYGINEHKLEHFTIIINVEPNICYRGY